MQTLTSIPYIIIDLYSGGYTVDRIGHELYNIVPNPIDHRYYGYCPPYNNVNIRALGAGKSDTSVENVMVIYVTKTANSNDRKIIAFTDNAKIYRPGIVPDGNMFRTFEDNDGSFQNANYCIESDTMYDLSSYPEKYIIQLKKPQMFHMQRFYKGRYPDIDRTLIPYLEKYLAATERDEDFAEQENIQEAHLPKDGGKNASKKEPEYVTGSNGRAVIKKPELAKQVLKNSDYKCSFDDRHITFQTRHSVPYMEGHHLIPCTSTNAQAFWDKYKVNIDCPENIVCICPTCHRRIHFGSEAEKREVIEKLYNVKKDELKKAKIGISLEELIELYKK